MGLEAIIAVVQKTLIFAVFLGILVIVHEWGHYITAVKVGVKVERFSFGFGPKLWSTFHKGTEFLICAIPLGGYVKMAGDERANCKGNPEEFFSKSPGERALIVFNGPLVNFILAYVCFVLVFMLGFPDFATKIGELTPGGPAIEAGLQVGDEITAVDGEPIYGWSELDASIIDSTAATLAITVLRNGQEVTKAVSPRIEKKRNLLGQFEDMRVIGVAPMLANKVGELIDGYPAKEAGLEVGDEIISIDGKAVSSWNDVQDFIAQSENSTILLTVIRDGKEVSGLSITPKLETRENENGQEEEVRLIGIAPPSEFEYYQFGFLTSVVKGWERFIEVNALTYRAVYLMINGTVNAKESVAGPVGIFNIVQLAAEKGLVHFLIILAVISANLAIINLFPIIPLDGGHLLLLAVEKIRGKALPPKVDDYVARIGFSLIILLFLFIFYVDFERIGLFNKLKGILPK